MNYEDLMPDGMLLSVYDNGGHKRRSEPLKSPNTHAEPGVVQRKWGTYKVLHETPNSKTKELTIEAGKSISLQRHFKRSEHWVIVQGLALAEVNGEEFVLDVDDYVYVSKCSIHKITAVAGFGVLKIIEVQFGECIEEDIERFIVEGA